MIIQILVVVIKWFQSSNTITSNIYIKEDSVIKLYSFFTAQAKKKEYKFDLDESKVKNSHQSGSKPTQLSVKAGSMLHDSDNSSAHTEEETTRKPIKRASKRLQAKEAIFFYNSQPNMYFLILFLNYFFIFFLFRMYRYSLNDVKVGKQIFPRLFVPPLSLTVCLPPVLISGTKKKWQFHWYWHE